MKDVFEHVDDFADSGSAQRFYMNNRGRILRYLSGEQVHDEGDFDWYSEWEKWARRQWEQQQQQQQQQYGGFGGQRQQQQQQQQHYQRQQRSSRSQKTKQEFHWDFDVNDP